MATANICDIFLRSAKITANNCGIFCEAQKIPLKISQNKPIKTYGSYMWVGWYLVGVRYKTHYGANKLAKPRRCVSRVCFRSVSVARVATVARAARVARVARWLGGKVERWVSSKVD